MTNSKSRAKIYNAIGGGTPVNYTAGGKPATGKVKFTANPTEGDTMVINATTFTFWDSGNEPGTDSSIEITIGGSLAATLATLETKVQAHATVGVSAGVIINADVDTSSPLDDFNMQSYPGVTPTLAATSSASPTNVAVTAFTGAATTSTIPLQYNRTIVTLNWADDSAALGYLTLPDGTDDKEVLIYLVDLINGSDSIGIIGTYYDGTNNLLTLGTESEYSNLKWISGGWREISASGSAFTNTNAVAL